MKYFLTGLFLLMLYPSLVFARSLTIEWDAYEQGTPSAIRFILYRGVNGGVLMPYQIFTDTTLTQFSDTAVKHGRNYCFVLQAVSEDGAGSILPPPVCAQPR